MGVSTAVCVLLLTAVFISTLADEHSLFYIYTGLNKDVALPGIDQFTALVLLDGREIDYYNSKKKKILKQSWMIEKRQEYYWEKGTQSRKIFSVLISDLHVLQWRTGCEIDESNGTVKFLRGISEYSYDGSDFLSFDIENMRWIALVPAAEGTKRKWDNLIIRNHYTKHYLEKYGKETLRNHSPPVVHAFATKSVRDPKKLILTCLATGFYPKDVELSVRKFNTSLPEHLLTSSGVRPNDDGTYQLRKSVEINGDDPADYDCYVHHSSFKEPVMKKWGNYNCDCCGSNFSIKVEGLKVLQLLSRSCPVLHLSARALCLFRVSSPVAYPVRSTPLLPGHSCFLSLSVCINSPPCTCNSSQAFVIKACARAHGILHSLSNRALKS
uniref:Ig-like domain-containing protein n=1 Tax=Astyanax mexicanus TaxID=7994 RepID=A0A3B1KK93_ASTMX